MPKDKNKNSNKSIGKALKASKGGNLVAKKEGRGGNNSNVAKRPPSFSSSVSAESRSTVTMGGSDNGDGVMGGGEGGGGRGRGKAREMEEQLRILKERQLGKNNPGYSMKTKKKAAIPVLAPSALGGISFGGGGGGGGVYGNGANAIKPFQPSISSAEASRSLVSALLDGESDSALAARAKSSANRATAPTPKAKGGGSSPGSGGGGQSAVRNTFSVFEDHSQTGTPGVSLRPSTLSLPPSRLSITPGSLSGFQNFQGFQAPSTSYYQ